MGGKSCFITSGAFGDTPLHLTLTRAMTSQSWREPSDGKTSISKRMLMKGRNRVWTILKITTLNPPNRPKEPTTTPHMTGEAAGSVNVAEARESTGIITMETRSPKYTNTKTTTTSRSSRSSKSQQRASGARRRPRTQAKLGPKTTQGQSLRTQKLRS